MKYVIHPNDKIVFHVDDKVFEEFMDAWNFMQFYRDMNAKCSFYVEYIEYKED